MSDGYEVEIYGPIEGNVDVDVNFVDGKRFTATFFTLNNIQDLMKSYIETGECGNGMYFWAEDMIIVQVMEEKMIKETIENLIVGGEFEKAFSRIE